MRWTGLFVFPLLWLLVAGCSDDLGYMEPTPTPTRIAEKPQVISASPDIVVESWEYLSPQSKKAPDSFPTNDPDAIEFAPESGVIEIRLACGRGGRLRLEIADPGPGVPEERADSLFSPYFSTRPGGVGLGLAIVRRIARAHGWRAGYRPRPGGGSIFWLDHADDR